MYKTSNKKQQIIEAYQQEPLKVGDRVKIKNYKDKQRYEIISIDGDNITIKCRPWDINVYNIEDIIPNSKSSYNIGINPFIDSFRVDIVNYSIESILSALGLLGDVRDKVVDDISVNRCNFNPYVIDHNGEKNYYQRMFVWSLSDKQNLIDSIYHGIDCGMVVVRMRSWEYIRHELKMGNSEVAFLDVVDGKQRITTMHEFINDGFCDSHGNYYSDLSNAAQNKILGSQLIKYATMNESATDKDVIDQFLKVNFAGVQQSKEHIDYVKTIYK